MNYLPDEPMSVELSGDLGLSQSDSDEDPSCSDSLSDIESDEVCMS